MHAALFILAGYVCGSIPFGVLLARWLRGVDVRTGGSGNIGATNVARVAGRKVGMAVLALDALKGALPVLLSQGLRPGESGLHAAVGLAAVLGHVFPIWLRLRGGKGVATAAGVLLVLAPYAALAGALTYAALVALARVSSLGSLVGGAVAVAVAWLTPTPREAALLASLFFALILWSHRANIRRLLRRSELKL